MLRLMTLNLNYRESKHGGWDARRELIADAIRVRQADVVALQAVECNGRNQAEELAQLLGYQHVAFVAAMSEGDIGRGSAFLSRLPLNDIEARRLSRRSEHEDRNDRVLIRAYVRRGASAIALYNAHFSWVLPQALDNARETLDFSDRQPAVVLGDLNSAPDSPALETLRRAGWTDLWAALCPNEDGLTFEADRPTLRIDYALATPDIHASVQSIERVSGGDGSTPRLSDHLGLLVTLRNEELPRL